MAARKGVRLAPKAESRMGKHANPRRQLLANSEQFQAWDARARSAGLTWAEWARSMLDPIPVAVSGFAVLWRERDGRWSGEIFEDGVSRAFIAYDYADNELSGAEKEFGTPSFRAKLKAVTRRAIDAAAARLVQIHA